MRILYLTNARLPTEKANGYQIMKMCSAFAACGADTTVLHPYRKQPDSGLLASPFDYYKIQKKFNIRTLYGVDWLAFAQFLHPRLGPYGFRMQAVFNVFATTLLTFRKWSISGICYYSRDIYSTLMLLHFRSFIRGKIVFEAHVFPEKRAAFVVKRFKNLDGLVCITEQLKRLFVAAGFPPGKILVAHDAVDLEQFDISLKRDACRERLNLPENKKIIGYIGMFHTMGMEKGIPELIAAMKLLLEQFPENPPLLLCVGGPMERVDNYKKISVEHGVSLEHIKFVDRVPNAEVPYWIKACDVVTIPWCWNRFSAYYTSPMKLFEYMASGVPIVASELPSLKEVLNNGENALLAIAGDSTDLAKKLEQLLSAPELGKTLGLQALADVKEYTWKKRAEKILELTSRL